MLPPQLRTATACTSPCDLEKPAIYESDQLNSHYAKSYI